MNSRIKSVRSTALCLLGALVLLLAHSLAFAGPHYLFSPGMFGDTAGPADLNDRGVIVWSGFGDSYAFGASWVNGDYVKGYGPEPCAPYFCGVDVTDINNAGDLLGRALKTNFVWVPTIWLAGEPYDLTDPANAGLTFHSDPGPKYVPFDLWALDVLGLPDYFNPEFMFPPTTNSALTNARGELVFGFEAGCCQSYGVLTVVPEPATLALLGVALAGLGFSRRRKLQ